MSISRQAGFSLIEVVIFIVVLGIGLAGMLVLYDQVTKASVDPLVRKQALAIAASLLEEIELRPFTYCDPDDANVFTATSTAECTAGLVEVIPNPPGTPNEQAESRYAEPRFDNVNDYNGFNMAGANIRSVDNALISGLVGYSADVAVVAAGGELPAVASAAEALRITVTVTGPTGVRVALWGYRLRYAPNSP